MHKNEPMKRTAGRMDTGGRKRNMKQFREEDIDTEGPLQSTQLFPDENITLNLDNYVFEKDLVDDTEGTFRLNATVENFLSKQKENIVNENENDDDDMEELPFDQDHNSFLVDEENDNQNDVDLLRATIVSLKIEIDKRDIIINEKENTNLAAQLENGELIKLVQYTKEEIKDKDEALDTATGRINSLEENKKMLENNLLFQP